MGRSLFESDTTRIFESDTTKFHPFVQDGIEEEAGSKCTIRPYKNICQKILQTREKKFVHLYTLQFVRPLKIPQGHIHKCRKLKKSKNSTDDGTP